MSDITSGSFCFANVQRACEEENWKDEYVAGVVVCFCIIILNGGSIDHGGRIREIVGV